MMGPTLRVRREAKLNIGDARDDKVGRPLLGNGLAEFDDFWCGSRLTLPLLLVEFLYSYVDGKCRVLRAIFEGSARIEVGTRRRS